MDNDELEEELEKRGEFIEDLQIRLEAHAKDIEEAQEIADDLAADIRSPDRAEA